MCFKTQPFSLFGAFGHFPGKTKKNHLEQRDDDWEGIGWRNRQKNMMFSQGFNSLEDQWVKLIWRIKSEKKDCARKPNMTN